MVFLQVLVKVVRSQNLSNLYELVAVTIAHEEGLLLEDLHWGRRTIEANMAPVDQISRE